MRYLRHCLLALACFLPLAAPDAAAQDTGRPDVSGAWYDPSHDGEGWIVEVLPDGRAVVYWFTYPPGGAEGAQTWILGQGRLEDGVIEITESFTTRGPAFGEGFDPAELVIEAWGTWTMTFMDCDAGSVAFEGPGAFGSGAYEIRRLSTLQGSACLDGEAHDPAATGFSGSWYDVGTDGQGIILQVLADGTALVYWFTYTPTGEQAWVLGVGTANGPRIEFPEVLMPTGAVFGDGFDPEDVELVPWGSLSLNFDACGRGVLNFRSSLDGWGHGSLPLTRLTEIDGHPCALPPPADLTKGRWLAEVPLSPALSEVAATVLGGKAYLGGGFGGMRSFLAYQPGSGVQQLPELPGERHHGMMASLGDSLYFLGGFSSQGGATRTVWRYRPGQSAQWTSFATMPGAAGAAAAVALGDHLYVVSQSGEIWRLNPASKSWRVFPGPFTGPRDHASAVAFRGELWWLGGRQPGRALNSVEIFDPVTDTWRSGPSMNYPHSGFAAAVLNDHIIVASGENPGMGGLMTWYVDPHTEVYSSREGRWLGAPQVRTPVHGVGGAALDGRFYLLGGSTIATATFGGSGVIQVYDPGG